MVPLAAAIRRRRRRLRQSLRQAAKALGGSYPVSASLLHHWEQGRTPGRRYLPALAIWLGIPGPLLIRLRRAQKHRRTSTANPSQHQPA